jgi:release factor glutamine methyltransferase
MGLEFEVTPDVLVPNPDTETLVTRVVEWGRERGGRLSLADVGTGSGCIAIAIAHFLPDARVDATDISPVALAVARRNVDRFRFTDRIRLFEGDLVDPLPRTYDAIVANLPYLAGDADLAPEVRAQPPLALFGGSDLVNRLLVEGVQKLKPAGHVFAEIDPAIVDALRLDTYTGHRLHRDLGGHERVLEAWR